MTEVKTQCGLTLMGWWLLRDIDAHNGGNYMRHTPRSRKAPFLAAAGGLLLVALTSGAAWAVPIDYGSGPEASVVIDLAPGLEASAPDAGAPDAGAPDALVTTPDQGPSTPDAKGAGGSKDDGGCQIGSGRVGSFGSLLLLCGGLFLLGLVLRRR